jgi:MFS family permease
VFVVAFVLSILPVFIVGRYVQETSTESELPGPRLEPGGSDVAVGPTATGSTSSRVIASYIVLGTLISGTAQMLRGLLPILATQYAGLSAAQTGIVYTASTVVVMFSGPLFGWLSDNVSQKLVLMVRGIANTLSSILFVALPNLAGITLGKVVDDVGKAAFKPAWGALMADVSSLEKKRRTQIISLMCLAEDAGEIGGPIVAGFLWSVWGVPVVLGVRILLALVTEVYATVLITSMKKRQRLDYSPPMRASRVVGS